MRQPRKPEEVRLKKKKKKRNENESFVSLANRGIIMTKRITQGLLGPRRAMMDLTEMKVLEIRRLYDDGAMTVRELSGKYGLSTETVRRIGRRDSFHCVKSAEEKEAEFQAEFQAEVKRENEMCVLRWVATGEPVELGELEELPEEGEV